jgi:hypothetical protein
MQSPLLSVSVNNTERVLHIHTFVIFSMLRTDLRRVSISRRVAMFLAPAGAAPATEGFAIRSACRESIVVKKKGNVVGVVRDGAEGGRIGVSFRNLKSLSGDKAAINLDLTQML